MQAVVPIWMRMKTMVRIRWMALIAGFSICAACAAENVVPASGWSGLERRISREQALAVLQPSMGSPLIVTRSRDRRFEVWTYDNGAHLIFVGGVLDYWAGPRTAAVAPARRKLV